MKSTAAILVMTLAFGYNAAEHVRPDQAPRFLPVEVFLDSPEPVAAWQFELADRNGAMTVVGVENGASPAFDGAPYYDRDATQAGAVERIVVADYTLADVADLPTGRTRVATVHMMIVGEPDLEITLVTATAADGRKIDASVSVVLPTDGQWRNRWKEEPAA